MGDTKKSVSIKKKKYDSGPDDTNMRFFLWNEIFVPIPNSQIKPYVVM